MAEQGLLPLTARARSEIFLETAGPTFSACAEPGNVRSSSASSPPDGPTVESPSFDTPHAYSEVASGPSGQPARSPSSFGSIDSGTVRRYVSGATASQCLPCRYGAATAS